LSNPQQTPSPKPIADEYQNLHHLGEELARGGQGVVFRTADADLAIKQPLDASGNPDMNVDLRERFQNIRLLPLPPRAPISLPLAILRDEPGYVMRLLNDMKPLSVFELTGKTKRRLAKEIDDEAVEIPGWIEAIPDRDMALHLYHYATTGSTRRRLFALSKCASILARIHAAGLVYGDISPNNVFIGDGHSREVWLIDADNLRLEMREGGNAIYTPHYGAPEIVQGRDRARPCTDFWAFAVMAFRTLTLSHPFIGKSVLEPEVDEGGWDTESTGEGLPTDLDDLAYSGHLPFIDDEDEDGNSAVTCPPLPRELVATSALRRLFQEVFGAGRTRPHRRPAMMFWALELARAFDQSLTCQDCSMSYFGNECVKCPYCDASRPPFARAKTPRWELFIPANVNEYALPHRLFYPFSLEHNDDTEYEATLDFEKKTAQPVRGTKLFPAELSIEFVGEEK
jgi:serine/threonine protein kinase